MMPLLLLECEEVYNIPYIRDFILNFVDCMCFLQLIFMNGTWLVVLVL